MSNPHTFRAWLRRRRQERGLTQEDLGELVSYAAQTIAKIESGRRRPSPQLALRLAEALQIALEDQPAWMAAALNGDDGEPQAPEPRSSEPVAPAPVTPAPVAPEAAPLRPPTPSPGLPAYLTPFVGRERERAELAALLRRPDCRLVTILGPGGVGKTRLAIEAGRASQGFPDGAAFVSLAPVTAPSSIVPAIGDALAITFAGMGDLLAQLVAHLRDLRVLLILDNLEHLLDPGGVTLALLDQLLGQAPGVTVLATSRERLRLAGEWVLELEGLPVPQPGARGAPATATALTLFVEHAERVDRAFRLTPENEATTATICRLVGGLPLGIELAVTWMRFLSLDEIAQELTRGLDGAHLSPRTLPVRHHSLRAVVDHSWELLGAEEREALRRLSVFQGGLTREAAARVAGAPLGVLASLVDKSLLRRGAGGRYDLHEIIRQYADARLQELPGEPAVTRERHAAYYLRLVAEREWRVKGADQLAALAELGAEIDNIRAAWTWAATHSWLAELDAAGEVMHWFYEFRSWLQEGAGFFEQAVEQLRTAGPGADEGAWRRGLGRMLGHYGYLAMRFGAFAQADVALAESHKLLASEEDALGLARTLLSQAQLLLWTNAYDEGRRRVEQGLALADTLSDPSVRALGKTVASQIAHAAGSLEEAEALFWEGLADWRALGNPRGTIWCITANCHTLLARGKHSEAEQLLRESLALSHASRDSGGMAMTLHNLGRIALAQGDAEEAIYFLREAVPLLRPTSIWVAAFALNDLGAALRQSGAKHEARRVALEAFATALQAHVHHEALRALLALAALHADAGQHAIALGLAARVTADPGAMDEQRRDAVELHDAARGHLPSDEAARVEARVGALPLAAILAELARPHPREL